MVKMEGTWWALKMSVGEGRSNGDETKIDRNALGRAQALLDRHDYHKYCHSVTASVISPVIII